MMDFVVLFLIFGPMVVLMWVSLAALAYTIYQSVWGTGDD